MARRGHILQREEKFRFIYDNFESDFGAYANKITRKGIEEDLKIFGVKTPAYLSILTLRAILMGVLADYKNNIFAKQSQT